MADNCPTCSQPWSVESGTIPPEPPIGTWMMDQFGSASVRCQNGRWAPSLYGFYAAGIWEPMWKARGPLVECPPYGREA